MKAIVMIFNKRWKKIQPLNEAADETGYSRKVDNHNKWTNERMMMIIITIDYYWSFFSSPGNAQLEQIRGNPSEINYWAK